MNPDHAHNRLRNFLRAALGPQEPPPPMTELVARLDAWLSRHRPAFYADLLPGLTAEEWAAFELQLGLRLPGAFGALYQWRNGQQDEFKSFRNNRYWMPAAEIVSTKELMDSMIGFDFEPGWWERSWVPFLHNGGGSHLCIDVVGTNGGTAGQLVEFWKADADRPIVSPSLEHWMHAFVLSLERDRWEETSVGFECVEVRDEQGE